MEDFRNHLFKLIPKHKRGRPQLSRNWRKNNKKKIKLFILICFTAQTRLWSSGSHHIQEVPPFGTISEFPHEGLLGWHNSSVPTHYMNTCMTSYHMNTCTASLLYEHMPLVLYIVWPPIIRTHVWTPIYQCGVNSDLSKVEGVTCNSVK